MVALHHATPAPESSEEPGDFIKSNCRACGGPIEFPAHGLGEWIDCPHCNSNIQLQRTARVRRGHAVAFLCILLLFGTGVFIHEYSKTKPTHPPSAQQYFTDAQVGYVPYPPQQPARTDIALPQSSQSEPPRRRWADSLVKAGTDSDGTALYRDPATSKLYYTTGGAYYEHPSDGQWAATLVKAGSDSGGTALYKDSATSKLYYTAGGFYYEYQSGGQADRTSLAFPSYPFSRVAPPIALSTPTFVSARSFDPDSLANPYGAGSPYKADGLMNPYSQYGSPYSSKSWRNPYATDAPKLYDSQGNYRGKLSANPYDPDSTSNPYGRYGSRYSADSINNPYGLGSPYSSEPVYVVPSRR